MKDFIYLNYDIFVDKIYLNYKYNFFFYNNYKVYIIKIKKEEINKIEKLIILTNDLYKYINVNTFLLNKDNNFISKYNDEYLCLIRVNNIENDFDLKDIHKFWNINSLLDDYNIIDDWEKEVDTLEQKLIEYNKEFLLIQNCINYFIGMAENAIQLLNDYSQIIDKHNDSIGHKISYELFNNNSLYDPLTFIKTNKMYDISNYIKYKFLRNELDYNEIESFFLNGNEYENVFLFSNLLYPNIFFDLVNNIMAEKVEEVKIQIFIKKRKNYIKLLSFCKKIVKNNKNIKLINWFN